MLFFKNHNDAKSFFCSNLNGQRILLYFLLIVEIDRLLLGNWSSLRGYGRLLIIWLILVLPQIIRNTDPVNVLLSGDFLLFFLFFVSFYIRDIFYVRETQNNHQVVNELNFHPIVKQYRWVFYLLRQSVLIGLDDTLW